MRDELEAMGYRAGRLPGEGDFLLQDDGDGPYLAAWYHADKPPFPVEPAHTREAERVEVAALETAKADAPDAS